MKQPTNHRSARRTSSSPAKKTAAPKPQPAESETILLAVTGMSPAILTETLWGLAHETPPVIPDKVRVITTGTGEECIQRELLTPSPDFGGATPWDTLRGLLLRGCQPSAPRLVLDDIQLIKVPDAKTGRTKPLDDIRSVQDNEAAADFLLDEVRRITENSDTTLIASMAGGRKTLGALLYACVSLIGRSQDRLTHVLVTEPFENPALTPRFYFPQQPSSLHQIRDPRTGKIRHIKSSEARITLVDVPFVRLRKLFPDQLGKLPGRFNILVETCSGRIADLSVPKVKLLRNRSAILIDGVVVKVAPREYGLYAYMLYRVKQQAPPIQQKQFLDELNGFLPKWAEGSGLMSFQRDAADGWKHAIEDDVRKQCSSLRNKFEKAGLTQKIPQLLPRGKPFEINVTILED